MDHFEEHYKIKEIISKHKNKTDIKRLELFREHAEYIGQKVENGINENRKGYFRLKFVDKNNNEVNGIKVAIKQKSHDFKFGGNTFFINQFGDERDDIYKEKYSKIFNYAVVPLYWNGIEPQQGQLRFDKNCSQVFRRPPLDEVFEFCEKTNKKIKVHPLLYHTFNPDWISLDERKYKLQQEEKVKAFAERYGNLVEDVDVLNEMSGAYKHATLDYRTHQKMPSNDDPGVFRWAFELARRYFPAANLLYNDGNLEYIDWYHGNKSSIYLMLRDLLNRNVDINGIGLQFHGWCAYDDREKRHANTLYNPLFLFDLFETYEQLGLPMNISEITIPAFTNSIEDEEIQAELVKTLYKIWFSRRNVNAITWWNLADGTAASGSENDLRGGLLRADLSEKESYKVIDDLINKEWRTDFSIENTQESNANFTAFFGEYEIITVYNGIEKVHNVTLNKLASGCEGWKNDLVTQLVNVE